MLGWESKETDSLILGKPLATLLTNAEDQNLLDRLSLYGGCLNLSDIRSLFTRIRSSATYFSLPTSAMQSTIEEYAQGRKVTPRAILKMAYHDAVEMLTTAIKRKEALYLLRDA